MQLVIYLLREMTGNPLDGRQIVHRSIGDATHTAETRQQPLPSFRADSLDFFQTGCMTFFVASGTHAGNGKTMRFVTNLCDQHQDAGILSQLVRQATIGIYQCFQTDLASLAFGDADDPS